MSVTTNLRVQAKKISADVNITDNMLARITVNMRIPFGIYTAIY